MTAQQYIRRIRTPAKRRYAQEYLAWMERVKPNLLSPPPSRGGVSYMAAQGVRMELDAIEEATRT